MMTVTWVSNYTCTNANITATDRTNTSYTSTVNCSIDNCFDCYCTFICLQAAGPHDPSFPDNLVRSNKQLMP